MNPQRMTRETAIDLRFADRETREPNPYDRILFAGTAGNRFQVLRRVYARGRSELKPTGAYDTLQEAIDARDVLPLVIQPARIGAEKDTTE